MGIAARVSALTRRGSFKLKLKKSSDLNFKSMIETIISSLFMIPFIVRNRLLFDEINRKLQNNNYKDKRQVFDDLTALIYYDEKPSDLTLEILLPDDKKKRTLLITREDYDRC